MPPFLSHPLIRWPTLFLASAGFVGYLPYRVIPFKKYKGAGLLGTGVGWGLFWCLPLSGAFLWGALGGMLALSVLVSHYAEKMLGFHDDPRIVIDEVIGVWMACLFLPRTWEWMLAGFVLFRVFDVLKGPWGRWAARAPGGWGVVADDVLAGLMAGFLLRMALFFVS